MSIRINSIEGGRKCLATALEYESKGLTLAGTLSALERLTFATPQIQANLAVESVQVLSLLHSKRVDPARINRIAQQILNVNYRVPVPPSFAQRTVRLVVRAAVPLVCSAAVGLIHAATVFCGTENPTEIGDCMQREVSPYIDPNLQEILLFLASAGITFAAHQLN